jgi:hypothetical protein
MGRLIEAIRKHVPPNTLPILVALLALVPALIMVWSPGYPRGADTWGHLFKAEYLADQMRADPLAYFTSSWMPEWYMGDPYRTYYPPLTTLVLAPLVYAFRDPFLAYRVFVSLFLILYAGFTYRAFTEYTQHWTAAFLVVLTVWSPYTLRTLFFEGNLPRALAVLMLPWLTYYTELIIFRLTGPRLFYASLAWAWTILAHTQQALMFAVGIAIYAVARVILDPKIPVKRLVFVFSPIAFGGTVAAPWALPAYSRAELSNIPYLPPIKIELFSAPLGALLPAADPGAIVFGLGAIILAFLAIAARSDVRRTAWLISGLLCLWFALGPAGVAFSLLPGHDQLLPERFANFSAFAIPLAARGLAPLGFRARYRRLAVIIALILLDVLPVFSLLRNGDFPADRAAIAERLAAAETTRRVVSTGGRVVLLTYPEPTALDVYFASRVGKHDQTSGWALENTPHHPLIRRTLSAPEWGPEYFARLMGLWDVRYAIVSGDDESAKAAREALAAMGFADSAESADAGHEDRFELWESDRPSTPIQAIPATQLLIVGDRTGPLLAAFPFAAEGASPNLSDYSPADLDAHPALALMQFAAPTEVAQAEAMLSGWVSKGRAAIVDLSGMEEPFSQGLDFLGVNVLRLSFQEPMPITWTDPLTSLPSRLVLPEPGWNGAAYRNLDVVLAEVDHNNVKYPVLGYKNIGGGRVWFVGLNLLYYAQITGSRDIAAAIAALTLADVPVSRQVVYDPVPTESAVIGDGQLEFVYNAPQTTEALISFTYSPRWAATVDGQPVAVGDYEHLIRLTLPARRHTLALTSYAYRPWIPRIGLLIGVLAVAGLAAGAIVDWRRMRNQPIHGEWPFVERRSPERRARTTYVPCPDCGFRFSEVAPPPPEIYPFNLTSCPICGQRFDQTDFRAGAELTPAAREAALKKWLTRRGYASDKVDPQRDFKVPGFFLAKDEIGKDANASSLTLPPVL